MPKAHWLCKTEPSTYSFRQLQKDQTTHWNDVRNFQARNHLRQMSPGDPVLIYHSGDERSVVGLAEVVNTAYPDPAPEGGDWWQIDLKAVRALHRPISLSEIKTDPRLNALPLVRQSRLSVMPISAAAFARLVRLGSR